MNRELDRHGQVRNERENVRSSGSAMHPRIRSLISLNDLPRHPAAVIGLANLSARPMEKIHEIAETTDGLRYKDRAR
jgi:hypothetical protein